MSRISPPTAAWLTLVGSSAVPQSPYHEGDKQTAHVDPGHRRRCPHRRRRPRDRPINDHHQHRRRPGHFRGNPPPGRGRLRIVRVAVPDREAADALPALLRESPVPLIADIHFDHRLALAAAQAGIHGLRINPGNIGDRDRVRQVVRACKERSISIRIGVNAGSIPEATAPDGRPKTGADLADAMVSHAMEHIRILEAENFEAIKISLKAFEVDPTIRAYRQMAERVPYPLHLGITESGTVRTGSIRSSIGLGILLYEGIGDTIRISLTADPVEEVFVAYEILKVLDMREKGSVLVSCPSCGRCEIELLLARRPGRGVPGQHRRTPQGRRYGLRC